MRHLGPTQRTPLLSTASSRSKMFASAPPCLKSHRGDSEELVLKLRNTALAALSSIWEGGKQAFFSSGRHYFTPQSYSPQTQPWEIAGRQSGWDLAVSACSLEGAGCSGPGDCLSPQSGCYKRKVPNSATGEVFPIKLCFVTAFTQAYMHIVRCIKSFVHLVLYLLTKERRKEERKRKGKKRKHSIVRHLGYFNILLWRTEK